MKRYIKATSIELTSLKDEVGNRIANRVAKILPTKYESDINIAYDEENSTLIVETPKGESIYNVRVEYALVFEMIEDNTSSLKAFSGKQGNVDKFIRDASVRIYDEN